jgi:hypothetical protein
MRKGRSDKITYKPYSQGQAYLIPRQPPSIITLCNRVVQKQQTLEGSAVSVEPKIR